jgi:sarcosine oxidase
VTGIDVIVLGTGGVGSAALHHLALGGHGVLGLDRFPPAHDRGSSHGGTRVIRLAYFEHPDYVPLLQRSYQLWEELQAQRGEVLYRQVGLIEVGPPDGEVVPGVLSAAALHGLDVESVDRATVAERFPGFAVPEGHAAVFERRAGFLRVEACVLAHLAAARGAGAKVRTGVTVHGWRPDGSGVAVDTSDGTLRADRLVVTAGPWSGRLLDGSGLDLAVVRKPMFWYPVTGPVYTVEAGCPVYLFETGSGIFYGFPALDGTVKVAEHTGGEPVIDPLTVDRSEHPADRAAVSAFLAAHLPGVDRSAPARHAVCMYTSTPDDHFVVDLHPEWPQVSFAAGLSGHGFKMTPVLGEALAGLATTGTTPLPIGFLRLNGDGRIVRTAPRDGATGPGR